jgi:hypothetical protein
VTPREIARAEDIAATRRFYRSTSQMPRVLQILGWGTLIVLAVIGGELLLAWWMLGEIAR